ncbi:hypothetical protein [Pseudalkalibacillus salsuginis]|uniref:hypothetical protein n=1 Tax=Pseudalkalibacillus salsuginis TaxID=2910972 RepID=UPI001F461889|nr:hypothetical protein [Pseudalkalibacillus salsuginis]MCF6408999.1 hypothetical protein [Pseudalkalibacillus salsuginis]
MDKNNFDDMLGAKLKQEYEVKEQQKEKTWKAIEDELDFIQPKKKKSKWIGFAATVAAAVILVIGLMNTTPGYALVDKVKEWFAPEKEVEIPIEGTEEEGTSYLNDQTEHGYVIYVDEERYKLEEHEGYDIITTIEPLPVQYPEVFMKIIRKKDQSVDETVSQLEAEHGFTFEQTNYPINAKTARTLDGNNWDSLINRYYVIPDEDGGSYIFHQRFFLEAEEGHGVRLDAMMKDFEIVEEKG